MKTEHQICTGDLPRDLQELVGIIGLKAVLQLCSHYGGERIYFPRTRSFYIASRDREIVATFNGRNHLELARRHKLTTTRIRQILAENGVGQKAGKKGRKKRS